MKYLLILFLFLNESYCFELNFKISKSIDKDVDLEPYIYGGRNATDGEVPWQVAIQNTGISEFLCGGSILTEWWIVTSAFCLNPILQT